MNRVQSFSAVTLTNALMAHMAVQVIPTVTTRILSSVAVQPLGFLVALVRPVITTQIVDVILSTVILDLNSIQMETTASTLTNVLMASVVALSTVSILKDLSAVNHVPWGMSKVAMNVSTSTNAQTGPLLAEVRALVSTPRVHMNAIVTAATQLKLQETFYALYQASMSRVISSIV